MVLPSGFRLESPPDYKSPVAFLYFLRCPDSDDVKYIGSAGNPIERYRSHISDGKKNLSKTNTTSGFFAGYDVFTLGSERDKWICRLLDESKLPVLEVVACVPSQFVVVAESQLYDSCVKYGYQLVNGVRPNDSQTRTIRRRMRRVEASQ